MRTFGLAASIVALLSSGAIAADVYNPGSAKDGAGFSGPVAVNWTGLYIGGSVGYGNANHELSLHDYFKDFCALRAQAEDPEFNAFEDNIDLDAAEDVHPHLDNIISGATPVGPKPARSATLKNVKSLDAGITGTDCESVTHPALTDPLKKNPAVTVSGDSREIASIDGVNSSGLVGDGRIGFDVARGRFLFGVFGSYGFNQMETDASIAGLGSASIEKGEEWSAGARAGILVNPRTLAYILAAYTQTDYEFGIAGGGSSSSREITFDGVTVGGGVEFAVTNNVFLGIEGTHTFYGKETIFDEYDADNNRGLRLDDEIGETKVMGTLKIKLNTGLGGVID